MFEFIYLDLTIPIPVLTPEGWGNIFEVLIGWFCIGTLVMAFMCVTELFNPYVANNYKLLPSYLKLHEEFILLFVAMMVWPVIAYVAYHNIKEINDELNSCKFKLEDEDDWV